MVLKSNVNIGNSIDFEQFLEQLQVRNDNDYRAFMKVVLHINTVGLKHKQEIDSINNPKLKKNKRDRKVKVSSAMLDDIFRNC